MTLRPDSAQDEHDEMMLERHEELLRANPQPTTPEQLKDEPKEYQAQQKRREQQRGPLAQATESKSEASSLLNGIMEQQEQKAPALKAKQDRLLQILATSHPPQDDSMQLDQNGLLPQSNKEGTEEALAFQRHRENQRRPLVVPPKSPKVPKG